MGVIGTISIAKNEYWSIDGLQVAESDGSVIYTSQNIVKFYSLLFISTKHNNQPSSPVILSLVGLKLSSQLLGFLMIAPVTLTVAQALVYAKTSNSAIIVQDFNSNIAASADALAALGSQIVSLQGDSNIFSQSISAADLLVLAYKTYYNGNLELFTTNDTAAYVAANASALQTLAARLLQTHSGLNITLNDTATNVATNAVALQILAAGLTQDIYVAGKSIVNNNSIFFTIIDTAINVIANTATLQTLAAGLGFDELGFLNLSISDTAVNVATNATALQSLAAKLAQDAYVVTYNYGTPYNYYRENNSLTLKISDTAAHIATNASVLQTLAAGLVKDTHVIGYDSGTLYYGENNSLTMTISDTAVNVAINATALQMLAAGLAQDTFNAYDSYYYGNHINNYYNNNSLSLIISDTAAHVATNASVLQTLATGLAKDSYVAGQNTGNYYNYYYRNNNSLTLTISDTVAHVVANATTLETLAAELAQDTYVVGQYIDNYGNYNNYYNNHNSLTLKISDTATNVVGNAASLQTLAAGLAKDSYVTGYNSGIPNYQDNNSLSLTISDTATNVQGVLDNLQGITEIINGITLTDSGTPTFVITASQYTKDLGVLQSISNSQFKLVITRVSIANMLPVLASSIATNSSHIIAVSSIIIADTAAKVLVNLSLLQTKAKAGQLSSIILTDSGTPTLTLSSAQLVNDAMVLAKISGAYQLAVAPITANALSAAVSNSHVVTPLTLNDTGANVFSVLDTVQANLSKISTIKLTDTTKPAVMLTAAQYVYDANALTKINNSNSYQLTITSETLANLSKDLSDSHVIAVNLSDSAAHVQAGLSALLSNVAKLGSITFTDASTPTLAMTGVQYAADTSVLTKISSAYNLSISGESASNVALDVKNSHITSIAVADTAARILNNLPTLESQLSKLSGITLTDNSLPTLSLTTAQIKADVGVLNDLQSPYLLSVKDTSTAISGLDLGTVHSTTLIELMPTSFIANTFTENTAITDLNLSLINLTGDTLNEKAYGNTGTEIDILAKGVVVNQLFFTHDTEAQLQLIGVGPAMVHMV